MPAIRTSSVSQASIGSAFKNCSNAQVDEAIYFPQTVGERAAFKTTAGKPVTVHQWNVYDFTKTIPRGMVSTYADVCRAVGGSPRSVGNALRNNPFAPYIPCHRVIASSLYIGGFVGEWGPESKTKTQYHRKVAILKDEGVSFTDKGYLKDKDKFWKGKNV